MTDPLAPFFDPAKQSVVAAVLVTFLVGSAASAQDTPPLVQEGQRAFVRNGCHGCHTVGRVGTPIAPDLSRVGAKYRSEYLARWLRDPSYLRPSTHMPALELTDDDIRALAAYLAVQQ